MTRKLVLLIGLSLPFALLTGCGGGDSSDNKSSQSGVPLTLSGRTLTLTVGHTTFSNSTATATATATFSKSLTVSSTDGGSGRKRHHEREGQHYMIHFNDEHNCVIHHPDTDDADESATYSYNRDAQTVEIEGEEHEIEHLDFTSDSEGHCHIDDDAGEAEDDDFVLT